MTSLPFMICLIARCWMADGFSKPIKNSNNINNSIIISEAKTKKPHLTKIIALNDINMQIAN